jgi:hypothetical protein
VSSGVASLGSTKPFALSPFCFSSPLQTSFHYGLTGIPFLFSSPPPSSAYCHAPPPPAATTCAMALSPHPHVLSQAMRAAWFCDHCKNAFTNSISFYCPMCDYDLCRNCFVSPMLSVSLACHQHDLRLASHYSTNWYCNHCGVFPALTTGRWVCPFTLCDFDICDSCASTLPRVAVPRPTDQAPCSSPGSLIGAGSSDRVLFG